MRYFASDYMVKDYIEQYKKTYFHLCNLVGEKFNVSSIFGLFPNSVFLIVPEYNGFVTEC